MPLLNKRRPEPSTSGNQRKRKLVKGCREFLRLLRRVHWPGWALLRRAPLRAAGPAVCRRAWLRAWVNSRAEAMAWHGAVRVPVTRDFSLYVVQAGSPCPQGGGQGCPDSVQPSW
jgi:hypothetical protein